MLITLDMVISGFVSKVVNDCVDVLKDKIKKADKNRKAYEQNIETRIYQVTIDALNVFTSNNFKNQDKLFDSAESILRGFKRSIDNNIDAVRAGLKMLVQQVTVDTCEDFLGTLCHEICKKENRDLAIEVIILQQEQTNGYIQEGFRRSYQNYEEINQKLDILIKELINKRVYEERNNSENRIENRAEEYAQKWDKNVFLNDFSERDENAGTNIKLREIYLEEHLPQYIWKANKNPRSDLKDLLKEYIVDNDKRRMLLILGQAGIGKSTLVTWILSNIVEQKDQILVYQFASDLKNVNWKENSILNEIIIKIGLKNTELEGKTLILDGLDEIYVNGDRERILNKLNQELKVMNILQRFSLIINCRENYIDQSDLGNIEYIILQAWNEEQIKSFCENYEKKSRMKNSEAVKNSILAMNINKILENKEVFGIPLILYMVLALNVDIEETSSRVEIYDQIFSLKRGGIYDRFYDIEHRINAPEIKKHIHRISQRIAFWMFENKANEAFISQEIFEEICENEMRESGKKGEEIQRDALIGNFFKLKYCEGKETDEIQFVHRSIYEYFVVVYFFESIHKLTSKEQVAGKLGELLKYGRFSEQILEYIKYKFNSMEGYSLSDITKEVFNMMLRDGMTYYYIKERKEPILHILEREMNIFYNMLEVVHLWNSKLEEIDNKIAIYLQHNNSDMLNLRGADLRGADLRGAILRGADLRGTDLREAVLIEANLRGVDLIGADLEGANLGGAVLIEANLIGADLREADLREAVLKEANLIGANLIGANLIEANLFDTVFDEKQIHELCRKYNIYYCRVNILETNKIISYKKYNNRKCKKRT